MRQRPITSDWSPESRLQMIHILISKAMLSLEDVGTAPAAATATTLYLETIEHLTRQPAEWLEAHKGLITDCLEEE